MDPMTGALVMGGIGALGSVLTNQTNAQTAKETNKQQMAFQRDMSNTAYQRSRKDLENAGYNPSLAYQNGGASTPSGSGIMSTAENPLDQLGGSAIQYASMKTELEQKKEGTNLLRAQKNTQETQQELNRSSARAANAAASKALTEKEILDSRKSAIKAESNFSEKESQLREKTLLYDYGAEKLNQVMGLASSAKSLRNIGTKRKEIYVDPKTGEILK